MVVDGELDPETDELVDVTPPPWLDVGLGVVEEEVEFPNGGV